MPSDADFSLLAAMADAADRLTLPVFRSGRMEVEIKDDGSPVTAADRAVEEALLAMVREAYPEDGFLGEEVGSHPGANDRTWIVDGIDGTSNFVALKPRYSTLVALVVDGDPVAGTLTSPALGRRWVTEADGPVMQRAGEPDSAQPAGAPEAQPTRLAVSTTAQLAGARVSVFPRPERVKERFRAELLRLSAALGSLPGSQELVDEPIPHGSVVVADGRIDAVVAFSGQAWDHAGPAALVTAAGGRFSDLSGGPRFDTSAGVYSNGLIHDELIAVLSG